MKFAYFAPGQILRWILVVSSVYAGAPRCAFALDEVKAKSPAESWSEIQPDEIRTLFGNLSAPSPNNDAGVKLLGHLAEITVERDETATPPFAIIFQQTQSSAMPESEFRDLCAKFRQNCFGQLEVGGFANDRLTPAMRKDWESPRFNTRISKATPPPDQVPGAWDPFKVPEGLSMPVDQLLSITGYSAHPDTHSIPFPFTQDTCSELAGICYRMGLYADGRAVADHMLARFPQNGRLLFIRGSCELALADQKACNVTLRALYKAWDGGLALDSVENINGPVAVRFLLAYLSMSGEK